MKNNIIELCKHEALSISGDDFDKFASVFASELLKEVADYMDGLKAQGFQPTSYLIKKHFGLL